jgi:hypothetical protein
MEFILEKIAERQLELSQLPQSVIIWVKFMRIWFFAGVVFLLWWKPARWIIATMVATGIAIIASKIFLPSLDTIRAGTIIQLMLWLPLAAYLVSILNNTAFAALKQMKFTYKIFGFWLAVSTLLVLISSALNIYNVAGWLI